MSIRGAQRSDVSAILELVKELAAFERAPLEVANTVEELEQDLFELNCCEAIVYEMDGQVVAFALFYASYSTWKGKCMYLEDLYVKEEYRKHGIGQLLFDRVVEIARERKYRRMDWQVLDWNLPAIKFYEKNNAILDPEWLNGRLFF